MEDEKEIKESLKLPEAPASVTYSITSKDGYNALFTIRAMSGKELLETMKEIEEVLIKKEYKPQVRQVFGQKKEVEYVQGKVCPKDGGKLIKKISKFGKEYHACENGRFDFKTGTRSGCDFVDWLNPKLDWDKNKPYSGKTMTAEDFDNL